MSRETGIPLVATNDCHYTYKEDVDSHDILLCIQTGKSKKVFREIAANPKVEICAFDGGKWLRLSGELYEDDRREARVEMLDAYPELRRMYNEDDGNTAVLAFRSATAVFSSFTEPPKTVEF